MNRRYKKTQKSFLRRQKQVKTISHNATETIDRMLLGRFGRLTLVKRFVISWLVFWLLLVLITSVQLINLSGYYQTLEPVPGGIYSEGMLGTMSNVNPIYATSPVDTSLAHLIFAGLFRYNSQNQLVGCLASGYSVNKAGTTYLVNLKPGLTWQDGKPLTAADVVFTFKTIQNPNAQSPLFSSWQNIKVAEVNSLSVSFSLPNPLASFPYSLTLGIIPQHILGRLPSQDLRSAGFNTYNPVGAGPFYWHAIQVNGNTPENASEQIALLPFRHYVLGQPKLGEFIFNAYANKTQLINAFSADQLTALAGLNSVPAALSSDHQSLMVQSRLLTAGDYVFFRTQAPILSDKAVRQALVLAANPAAIIAKLGYPTLPVKEPLLIGQLAFNPKYAQVTDQPDRAVKLLAADGWKKGSGGWLVKNNTRLQFNLVASNTPENRLVGSMLKAQWRAIGVDLVTIYETPSTYTTTLQDHNYDSTLNGISIGIDPDVFVYWDGSQYDPRSSGLNFSEYNSTVASQALEAGRTRLNPALRIIKYQPFLAAWQSDAPALGLFQPRFLYISRQHIYGMGSQVINSPSDRFDNVQNWEVLTANVTDPRP